MKHPVVGRGMAAMDLRHACRLSADGCALVASGSGCAAIAQLEKAPHSRLATTMMPRIRAARVEPKDLMTTSQSKLGLARRISPQAYKQMVRAWRRPNQKAVPWQNPNRRFYDLILTEALDTQLIASVVNMLHIYGVASSGEGALAS